MGYIKHDVAVLVGGKELTEYVEKFKAELPPELQGIVVGPYTGVNHTVSAAFLPDGSKEGWDASERGDEWRERFVNGAKGICWGEALTVRFGGDDDVQITSVTELKD